MADQKVIKAPSQDGDELSVYFQSTKCDMETKTSKSGKSYRNFLYEVIVAGEEEVSVLAVYEKNQQFLDQLAKFKPTKDDLCVIRAKAAKSKSGFEFTVLTLEIPSKGLGGEGSGSAMPYQGETKEERHVRNVVIGVSWALELVYKANHPWFVALDHENSNEEERIKSEGFITGEVNKLLSIRDKLVKARLNKSITKQPNESNKEGSKADTDAN